MNKKSIPQSRSKVQPSKAYPELFNKLARIAILTRLLHAETTDTAIGDILGIAHQNVNLKVNNMRKEQAK